MPTHTPATVFRSTMHSRRLLRFFLLIFGNQSLAEELAIESFLRHARSGDDPGLMSLLKYACQIAVELGEAIPNQSTSALGKLELHDRLIVALYGGLKLPPAAIAELMHVPDRNVGLRLLAASRAVNEGSLLTLAVQ